MNALIHFFRFLVGVDSPHSQVTDDELQLLLKYSRTSMTIVELGSYEGRTASALAECTPGCVYSIDTFKRGRLGICYGEYIAKIHAKRKNLKNIYFIKGFSYNFSYLVPDLLDFLFIDADHSYDAVKKDWLEWYPKMVNGGVIALHDCKIAKNSTKYLGSMQFYDNDIPKITTVKEIDSVDSLVLFRVQE